MAEQTEVERVQKKYEEQLAEQRAQSEHQFQVAMKMQEVRNHELREGFEERKREFLAQNDGLLGAVGRLHKETESLKAQVTDLRHNLQEAQGAVKASEDRFHLQMAVMEQESDLRRKTEHAQMQREIDRLTAALEKTKKPKKK